MAQHELGARLRTLREHRGLTVDEVAQTLVWPFTRVRELESGVRHPTAEDLAELKTLLKLDEATAGELAKLASEGQRQGWWSEYGDLRVPYIGLEEHASVITTYTTHYFPALVQTAEYAQAIITGIDPKLDSAVVRQRVDARMRRQHILGRSAPLKYEVILDQSVLQRPVGGRAVMRHQLDNVLPLIHEGKAAVRIIPLEVGANAAQDSNFVVLDFATPGVSSIAYSEGLAKPHYLDRKKHVDRYREAIGYLLSAALSQEDSIQLIVEARNFYARG